MRRGFLIIFLAASAATEGQARLLLSQGDALSLAFPAGAAVEKKTAFLSEEQAASIQTLGRAKVESRIWTYYVATSTAGKRTYAYFDRIIIRTLPATIMAAVGEDGDLKFLEVLSFNEPEDYLPRKRWLTLFQGRILEPDLRVGGLINNVSGATITSQTLTAAARRMLALHAVLEDARKNGLKKK